MVIAARASQSRQAWGSTRSTLRRAGISAWAMAPGLLVFRVPPACFGLDGWDGTDVFRGADSCLFCHERTASAISISQGKKWAPPEDGPDPVDEGPPSPPEEAMKAPSARQAPSTASAISGLRQAGALAVAADGVARPACRALRNCFCSWLAAGIRSPNSCRMPCVVGANGCSCAASAMWQSYIAWMAGADTSSHSPGLRTSASASLSACTLPPRTSHRSAAGSFSYSSAAIRAEHRVRPSFCNGQPGRRSQSCSMGAA
ncbi:hypothetical protein CV_2741 [Chromobacterium violaceum ATCC 12472]|uniref:Uncharacterized protein n=1 Tax=Chromobacterium violaceum (strain ATCC 12472 / DSM 30191 / JCM 1249 / CCUG 213 / NBRC 12614 / NCIMB 9131 / NCTC 9757 / MK) TaxID=243365 RepID=Q7NPS0_CHRVO|nr:hypothetical protein CV_2741 [Chromobacterium violaceum ATCC 12472]